MQNLKSLLIVSLFFMSISLSAQCQTKLFDWGELPAVPDNFGFAGAFAGVANDALLVAGGASFPDGGAPWTGSKKVWSDKIFALDAAGKQWKLIGKLPMTLGYGVSITYQQQLICIGGSNQEGHTSKVYALSYKDHKLGINELAELPSPLANASGALVGSVVYVAGGLVHPSDTTTASIFWSLDLKDPKAKWSKLESWPGPSRMLAVAASKGNSFYLFSGTDLVKSAAGQVDRVYLTDAYSFEPNAGWKKLKDLPKAVVAAPSPAYQANENILLVFGGDDGKLATQGAVLKEKHPGFSGEILAYDGSKNDWFVADKILKDIKSDAAANPNASIWPAVTNSMVIWQGKLVFPMGEVRPAVRTPRVIVAKPLSN